MSDDIAISVSGVSKYFEPSKSQRSIKQSVVSFFGSDKDSQPGYWALKDVSFEIKKGEFFGIVGRNGSGKSTLLKMMAGVYTPTKGHIEVSGKLVPFIELGVGFNPELSGRDNVFLNGALLGFTRKEIAAMYDEIVEFAEIEDHMGVKLKNFSSGMQVRLAFSIAIRAKADILLIDEVLAVGDASFQRKCYEYFVNLKRDKKTVVLVTHDMGAVERFCTQAIIIQDSKAGKILTPLKAGQAYARLNAATEEESAKSVAKSKKYRWGSGKVKIDTIEITGDKKKDEATCGGTLNIEFALKAKKKDEKSVLGLAIYNQFGQNLSGPNSIGTVVSGSSTIRYTVKNLALTPGRYRLLVIVFDENAVEEFDHLEEAAYFEVTSSKEQHHGMVELFGSWSTNE
jgi:ABC-2 type transport system ATP-binding protein